MFIYSVYGLISVYFYSLRHFNSIFNIGYILKNLCSVYYNLLRKIGSHFTYKSHFLKIERFSVNFTISFLNFCLILIENNVIFVQCTLIVVCPPLSLLTSSVLLLIPNFLCHKKKFGHWMVRNLWDSAFFSKYSQYICPPWQLASKYSEKWLYFLIKGNQQANKDEQI